MITKKQDVEYVVSTPKNCTCTYLAEHLEDVSHDVVNDFLHQKRFLPREVWKLVKDRIEDSPDAFILVADSVQDKRYSRFIELVRAHYSGNEQRVSKGIGVVNWVHSAGKDGDFYPIDYRVDAPDVEGKTKNDHFQELFVNALELKPLQARTILFDGWYAAAENLKLSHRRKRSFFTTLKSNRVVRLSQEAGYCHLEDSEWTAARLAEGVLVKLKAVPLHVRLFKLVAPDGASDWGITNELAETVTAQGAKDTRDVRWQVEELHRGIKQLTGSEKCQCRAARVQRNHLACCYHAWVSLKVKAQELGQTLYAVRESLFSHYLRAELRNPHVTAC
jgi:Archaeal putative transposase ISC1217